MAAACDPQLSLPPTYLLLSTKESRRPKGVSFTMLACVKQRKMKEDVIYVFFFFAKKTLLTKDNELSLLELIQSQKLFLKLPSTRKS